MVWKTLKLTAVVAALASSPALAEGSVLDGEPAVDRSWTSAVQAIDVKLGDPAQVLTHHRRGHWRWGPRHRFYDHPRFGYRHPWHPRHPRFHDRPRWGFDYRPHRPFRDRPHRGRWHRPRWN